MKMITNPIRCIERRILKKGLLMAVMAATACAFAANEELEEGFRTPPDSARPICYWIWMNGNVTREGITADLEAMAKAGIGGGFIFTLGGPIHKCDTPSGPAEYLSPHQPMGRTGGLVQSDRSA